jgi:hypothetical protein
MDIARSKRIGFTKIKFHQVRGEPSTSQIELGKNKKYKVKGGLKEKEQSHY